MQDKWSEFLEQQGATIDSCGNFVFDNHRKEIQNLQTGPQVISLDHLGIIRVQGEDAQNFLQGQLTNDITQLANKKIQLSGYCNPKGRMLAQFIIIPDRDAYILLIPKSILDKTISRLKMFILRSKVEINDMSQDYNALGLAGNNIQDSLANLIDDLPENEYDLTMTNDWLVTKLPGIIPRYLVVLETRQAITLWESLSKSVSIAGPASWNWLDIQAGLPIILPETLEEFVPQMVNLELLDAVNFKKGCYTGQEIVARMHYLGKAKRRMFRLHQDEESIPSPGTDIFDANGDTQSVGKVVNVAPSPEQGVDLLAVLQLTHTDTGSLRLGSPSGTQLQIMTLPYPLPNSD